MRIKITDISPRDGYFPFRAALVGRTGTLAIMGVSRDGWTGGKIVLDQPVQLAGWKAAHRDIIVAFCKFDTIDNKPAKMIGPWGILWEYVRLRWLAFWNK